MSNNTLNHSTGPRTEAGKRKSSLNAMRHGLTAQVSVMPAAERAAFEAFSTPIIASFHPATPMETQLALTIATCQWRLNRAATIEEGLYTRALIDGIADNIIVDHEEVHTAVTTTEAFEQNQKTLARLALYASRLTSQSDKACKLLKQMQLERKTKEAKDLQEAIAIQRYLDSRSIPFIPADHGFVFSPSEIRTQTDRQILRERANCHVKTLAA